MSCDHTYDRSTGALMGCDGTCLVEQELEDRDVSFLSTCCGSEPVSDTEVSDGIGLCGSCRDLAPFEALTTDVDHWARALKGSVQL